MSERQNCTLCKVFVAVLWLATSTVSAEIYKWQDASGRWHFSDSPKGQQGSGKKVIGGEAAQRTSASETAEVAVKSDTSTHSDLKAKLAQKYPSESLIQTVTFSVVGIETAMGTGSGFFVSDDGYLITNRHVVRPTSTKTWEEGKALFEQEAKKLEQWSESLKEEKRDLDDYATKLESYRKDLEKRSGNAQNNLDWSEYRDYESRFAKRRAEFDQAQTKYQKRAEVHQEQRGDFNFKSSLSGVSQRFKVFLKDNTELNASLVSISSEHDLALLKLDGYQTPSLSLHTEGEIGQGQTVYAIGSPLGMRDSVTKGIVAKLEKDYVITDAQIQPGNSGGPLVNDDGKVIGVNTMKFHTGNVLAEGFGMAIPVSVIRKEFSQHLAR